MTVNELDKRANCRRDSELPRCTTSMMEQQEPNRDMPSTVMVLESLAK
jgi:hypothetical protein